MPKEINWNQFDKLNEKQRQEFETFVNTYGQILEDTLGILIDETFVDRKLKENGENFRKAWSVTEYRNSIQEKKNSVQREIPDGMAGISRGYGYYLTDDHEENQALADSLSTKEGRQALFHRMVKDLMDTDLNDLFENDTGNALDNAVKNPKIGELMFISENINSLLDKKNSEFSLEEPLKTAFKEKYNILETVNNNREKAILSGSPMGVLLGGENLKEKLGDQLDAKLGELYAKMVQISKHDSAVEDPMVFFIQAWQAPPNRKPFDTMHEKGWLNDNVHILDETGMVQNKRTVYRAIENGSKKPEDYQVRESTPEEMRQLQEQKDALPVYRSKREFLEMLQKSGLPDMEIANYKPTTAQKDFMVVVSGQKSMLKLSINDDTGKFQLGEAVSEPEKPERPNLFKRIMHSISNKLFKKDFDEFDKATKAYNETMECLSKKDELQAKLAERNESPQQKAARAQQKEREAAQERANQVETAIMGMSKVAAENIIKDGKETVFGKYAASEGMTAMESMREYATGTKPIQGNEAEIRKNLAKYTAMEMLHREQMNPNMPQTMTTAMEKFMDPKNKGKIPDPVETMMQHPGFRKVTQDDRLTRNTITDIVTKRGEPVFRQMNVTANQLHQKENTLNKSQTVEKQETSLGGLQ